VDHERARRIGSAAKRPRRRNMKERAEKEESEGEGFGGEPGKKTEEEKE